MRTIKRALLRPKEKKSKKIQVRRILNFKLLTPNCIIIKTPHSFKINVKIKCKANTQYGWPSYSMMLTMLPIMWSTICTNVPIYQCTNYVVDDMQRQVTTLFWWDLVQRCRLRWESCIQISSCLYCKPLQQTTIVNHYCKPLLRTTTANHYCEPLLWTTIANLYCKPLQQTSIANHYCKPI